MTDHVTIETVWGRTDDAFEKRLFDAIEPELAKRGVEPECVELDELHVKTRKDYKDVEIEVIPR